MGTPYVARFRRWVIALMILAGPGLPAGAGALVWAGVLTRHQGGVLGLLLTIPALVIAGFGVARLVRAWSSGWAALTIDAEGIGFGTQANERPRRFAWDEISALVLFSRRTEFVRGTVRCVGIRLHPAASGSPEHYLRSLERALAGSTLSPREREELNRFRDVDLEAAVSFHIEARGWRRRPARLRKAMRTHAPGVPILQRTSADYHDLVGWRAGRDLVEQGTMWGSSAW
jgi:hypothetical protein